jgi:hypothetical protein
VRLKHSRVQSWWLCRSRRNTIPSVQIALCGKKQKWITTLQNEWFGTKLPYRTMGLCRRGVKEDRRFHIHFLPTA